MVKMNLKRGRLLFPKERLEGLVVMLGVFSATCTAAAQYDRPLGLLNAVLYAAVLVFLIRFRTFQTALYALSGLALLLLFVIPDLPLYGFLLSLYPLLLILSLLHTSPAFPSVAGLIAALLLFRYQDQLSTFELGAHSTALVLNTVVYSVLTYLIRQLLKERNEYRHLSMIDSLTGLHSLQQTLLFGQRLLESGHPVRVILIDLDHFKKINDTFGHMVGNQVIVHVAEELKKAAQGLNGLAGRLGGDEFVLVLEDRPHTAGLLELIDTHLNHSLYRYDAQAEPIVLSFSIGESVSTDGATHMEQLMHNADLHMYERKLRTRSPLTMNQSEQFFERHPDPICTFDNSGMLLDMNPAAERLLGYKAEEMKDRSFLSLICPSQEQIVMEYYATYTANGSPVDYDLILQASDGRHLQVRVANIPIIIDHKIVGFYALTKDQTAIRLAEEIQRQAEKAEQTRRTAAVIASDLQGPIKAIRSASQLLREQERRQHDALLQLIQNELEHMTLLLQMHLRHREEDQVMAGSSEPA